MPPPKFLFPPSPQAKCSPQVRDAPILARLRAALDTVGVDLGSHLGSSHPSAQGPPMNGATSTRVGGVRVGSMGSSTASGGQEHLDPKGVGSQPLLSLGVLPSIDRRVSGEWCCDCKGWWRAGGVEGHLDSEGWIGACGI